MRIIRRAVASLTSLAIGLAALSVPAAAGDPTTRYVDDDGTAGRSGCGGTRSVPRKVQRAIHNAGPGDTILVCPGTYTEQLTITGARDGLTVKGVEPWKAVIRTPRDLIGRSPSLITIDGVDRVRLQSLRLVADTVEPCDKLSYGVRVRAAHETELRSLRIAPAGSDTLGPCGYNRGIAVHQGASAFIGYNLIRDFRSAGIWVYGARTNATIYRNSIRFVHAAEAPDSCCGIGIGAFSGPLVTIRDNAIRSGPGPGWPTPVLDAGMELALGDGSVVARNTVRRTSSGISTEGDFGPHAPRAIIRGNVITGGPPESTGLNIDDDASTYSGNRVSAFTYGVYVAAGYNGQSVPTLRGNDFRGNHSLDCYDDGPGADGVLSIWVDNLGDTSQPAGICSPAP